MNYYRLSLDIYQNIGDYQGCYECYTKLTDLENNPTLIIDAVLVAILAQFSVDDPRIDRLRKLSEQKQIKPLIKFLDLIFSTKILSLHDIEKIFANIFNASSLFSKDSPYFSRDTAKFKNLIINHVFII